MHYYFNPNYKLINDKNKVILISRLSFLRKFENFEADTSFQTFIHPVFASFLAFFNGNELEKIYKEISIFFNMPQEIIRKQLSILIHNKEEFYINFNDSTIVFPKYTIVKTNKKIDDYYIYDPKDFLNYEEVNITPGRTFKPIDLTLMLNSKCYTDCILLC